MDTRTRTTRAPTTAKRKPNTENRRTRVEPPTLEEAIFAAQGLSDDLGHQARIAALLMGLPEEEVRPHVKAQPPMRFALPRERHIDGGNGRPAVVVVRRRPRVPGLETMRLPPRRTGV